jgi:hypothetical protein
MRWLSDELGTYGDELKEKERLFTGSCTWSFKVFVLDFDFVLGNEGKSDMVGGIVTALVVLGMDDNLSLIAWPCLTSKYIQDTWIDNFQL